MSWNFGFGYNKMNNFNKRIDIEGPNTGGSSLSDVFVINANGNSVSNLDQFNEGLAFDTFVIDSVNNGQNSYFSNVPLEVTQKKSIETSGGMGETVVSVAGNYNNKLYIGLTAGFPHINYWENTVYSETAIQTDTISGFRSFKMEQQVVTRGTGINVKLGLIYKIADWIRFGMAIHSPTQFSLHDDYVTTMTSNFSAENFSETSPNGYFYYSLITPPRVIGSLGFVIASRGLLCVDAEAVDYSYAKFSSSTESFSDVNNAINKKYAAVNNLRVGGEWKMTEEFTIRAGFAMYATPYRNGFNSDAGRYNYTAGLGYRKDNFFIDLASVMTQYKEDYYLYGPTSNLNPARNTFSSMNVLVTFGAKF
jgi:long-subunit fatty acid transport protein